MGSFSRVKGILVQTLDNAARRLVESRNRVPALTYGGPSPGPQADVEGPSGPPGGVDRSCGPQDRVDEPSGPGGDVQGPYGGEAFGRSREWTR